MNNKNLGYLEFATSLITAILLGLVTYLQYSKNRPFWWIILIVTIVMAANAYIKYKQIDKPGNL